MQLRHPAWWFTGLNAALLACSVWLMTQSPDPVSPARLPTQVAAPAPLAQAPQTHFNWSQVESADYRTYVANLRRIGCPQETICDIVIADVNKLFAGRAAQVRQRLRRAYWQADQPWPANLRCWQEQQLADLDWQRRALLHDLLGIDVPPNPPPDTPTQRAFDLDFIAADKRPQVLDIQARFRAAKQALYAQAEAYGGSPDWASLRAAYQQRESDLAALLSPTELAQYQLRFSEAADQLRRNLVGFDASEAEFQSILPLLKVQEDKYAFTDPNDTALQAQRVQDKAAMQQQLKTLLGDDRFAAYQRGADHHFQQLFALAQQENLPPDTAAFLYDQHQQMQAEITTLETDPTTTAQARDQAVRRYQAEFDAALQSRLGSDGYAQFLARGLNLGN